jgi:hypothetical protein
MIKVSVFSFPPDFLGINNDCRYLHPDRRRRGGEEEEEEESAALEKQARQHTHTHTHTQNSSADFGFVSEEFDSQNEF